MSSEDSVGAQQTRPAEPARLYLFDTVMKCRHCGKWSLRIWTDWMCRACWRNQRFAPCEYEEVQTDD